MQPLIGSKECLTIESDKYEKVNYFDVFGCVQRYRYGNQDN